jgi:hypothetical protein
MSQIRNHKWDKDDSILTLYYVLYGVKNLPVKDEKEFAEWIIGSSVASLTLQSANVRYLLGYNKDAFILDCYSHDQEWAVEKYSKYDREQLEVVVNKIIESRDVKQNIEIAKEKAKMKNKKFIDQKRKTDSQLALEEALRRMGKDPSKFKSLGVR